MNSFVGQYLRAAGLVFLPLETGVWGPQDSSFALRKPLFGVSPIDSVLWISTPPPHFGLPLCRAHSHGHRVSDDGVQEVQLKGQSL